jgi:hypothetical protein
LGLVLAALLLAGIGVGLSTNAALTLLRAVTPPAQIGRAASAHQFIRNQGFTVGSALGGSVMLFVVAAQIGAVEPVQRLLAGEDPALTVGVAEAVAAGYAASMIVATVIAAMAVFPVLSLRRHLAPARAAADEARRA